MICGKCGDEVAQDKTYFAADGRTICYECSLDDEAAGLAAHSARGAKTVKFGVIACSCVALAAFAAFPLLKVGGVDISLWRAFKLPDAVASTLILLAIFVLPVGLAVASFATGLRRWISVLILLLFVLAVVKCRVVVTGPERVGPSWSSASLEAGLGLIVAFGAAIVGAVFALVGVINPEKRQ